MPNPSKANTLKADLLPHWLVVALVASALVAFIVISHVMGASLQEPAPEDQRVFARTLFYVMGIIMMPITNLIRHIQLRLNQTMPGDRPSKMRYFYTVVVSMVMVETIGVFGFVMYMLGDGFNTLYIFAFMSALGMFLYRPKLAEYEAIIDIRERLKTES
ncbi:hypothetical protein JCM14076_15660 [Methylosoma difficile]